MEMMKRREYDLSPLGKELLHGSLKKKRPMGKHFGLAKKRMTTIC